MSSSTVLQFDKIGFSSMTHSGFIGKTGIEAGSGVDICLTSDCDTLGMNNGKIAVMSVSQSEGVSLLRVNESDLVDFTTKKASSRAFASYFITDPPSSPQPPHTSYTLSTVLNSPPFAHLTNCPRPFPPLSSQASPQASSLIPAEQCWIFQTCPLVSILLPASPCLLACQKQLFTICDQCQAKNSKATL
jgi:hypothetical protein